jgi:hypothetical protein
MLTASINRAMMMMMMEAARTSETSVNFYETTRLHRGRQPTSHSRRENLKSHQLHFSFHNKKKQFLTREKLQSEHLDLELVARIYLETYSFIPKIKMSRLFTVGAGVAQSV